MDKVTPKCPWCGKEMEPDRSYKSMLAPGVGRMFWYSCDLCGSVSPRRDSPESAYAAAMRRWVELNRVLTWDEFVERIKLYPVWLEDKTYPRCSEWVNPDEEPYTEWEFEMAEQAYGKFGRAWLRRPTDEERASTPWTQNDA